MPTIQKSEELAALLGGVIQTENPVETLKQQGFNFSAEMQSQLQAAQPSKTLSAAERARWAQKAEEIGPVKFSIGKVPLAARGLPSGEYDFIFSLRLEVIHQVLASLYGGLVWPHEIAASQAGQLFPIQELRDFADGIPQGETIQVGSLHFTAPPTLTPVEGAGKMILHQPFSLDIENQAVSPHQRVTSLDGVLTFGVLLKAEVREDLLSFSLDGDADLADGTPGGVHLLIAPASPLQPRSPQVLSTLEDAVHLRWIFGVVLLGKIKESYSISPNVRLPIGSGVTIRVQQVDARSVQTDGEGALVVGVLLGPTATPDEGAGDPSRLVNPFSIPAVANVYARVHEELLRKVVRQALESGEIQRQANQERDDVVIEDADIDFKTNEIRLILKGRLVDACSFDKDLGFTATKTYHYSVFGDQITVTESQDTNLDDSDVVFCLVLGGLQALIAGLAFGVIGSVIDILSQVIHFVSLDTGAGGGDVEPLRLNSVFSFGMPIPGTEVLPEVETLQSRIEDLFMEANGIARLVPDEVNTYIYAAFRRRPWPQTPFGPVFPLENVQVELIDQDAPRPAGDDTVIPPSEHEETAQGPHRLRIVTKSFQPANRDHVLAKETTNSSGRVRFVLKPSQLRTVAGTMVIRTQIIDAHTAEVISSQENRQTIFEQRPDIYFQVTLANNEKFDTRAMAGGFTLNLAAKRIGSPGAPLVFTRNEDGVILGH